MPSAAYSLERAEVFARHTAEIKARKIAEAEAEAKEKAARKEIARVKGITNRRELLKKSNERQARLLRREAIDKYIKGGPLEVLPSVKLAKQAAFKKEKEPYLKYGYKLG
jgi:hypothetical protein